MAIRAVVFDRDGVLTYFDVSPLAAVLASIPRVSMERLYGRWAAWCDAQPVPRTPDEESRFVETFWDDVVAHWNLDATDAATLRAFDFRDVLKPFDDARPILAALRARGIRVGVLSNAVMPNVSASLDAVGLGDLVDSALATPAIGCSKPAPEAYMHALNAIGVAPDEALFVDDELPNVVGARAIGMRAVLVNRAGKTVPADPASIADIGLLTDLLEGA